MLCHFISMFTKLVYIVNRKIRANFQYELLKEIQRYSSGELVYIPKAAERKKWGEDSGAKPCVSRNTDCRRAFADSDGALPLRSQKVTVAVPLFSKESRVSSP